MGWGEWPLFFFTVIAQSAVGAFWWCCVALLAGGLAPGQYASLERSMLVIWLMVAFAFSAAVFHLGTPLRAINASFRFGRTHFSNEVVFGSIFVGLGLIGWIMATRDIGGAAGQLFVLGLTLLCSFAFLASMIALYMIPTVPTWNTPLTPAAYILTAVIGGSIVAATLFSAAGITAPGSLHYGPAMLAPVALLAAIIVTLLQGARLPRINSSIKRAVDLSPHYASLMAVRFVILFTALGIWLYELAQTGTLSVETGIACAILMMVGEIVGRGVHYGLHMTVGLH
jgi:anaerobic dimethyl sulfoxide reductase subunit C (anchor subunit)